MRTSAWDELARSTAVPETEQRTPAEVWDSPAPERQRTPSKSSDDHMQVIVKLICCGSAQLSLTAPRATPIARVVAALSGLVGPAPDESQPDFLVVVSTQAPPHHS